MTATYTVHVGTAIEGPSADTFALAGIDALRHTRTATCFTYACAIDAVLNEIDAADRLYGPTAAICVVVNEEGGQGFLTLPWMRPATAGEAVYAEAVTL